MQFLCSFRKLLRCVKLLRVLRTHYPSGILSTLSPLLFTTDAFGFHAVRKDKRAYDFKRHEKIITPIPIYSVYQQPILAPRVCEHDIHVFTVIPLAPKP
jgi:hypothetical protein